MTNEFESGNGGGNHPNVSQLGSSNQTGATVSKIQNDVATLITHERGYVNPVKQADNLVIRLSRNLTGVEQIDALIGKSYAEALDTLLNSVHTYKDLFDKIPEIQELLKLQDLHISIIPGEGAEFIDEYQNLVKELKLSENNSCVTLLLHEDQKDLFTKKIHSSDNRTKVKMRNTEQLVADIHITSKLLPRDNLKEVGPIMQEVIDNLGLSIISTLKNIRNDYLHTY